MTRGSGWPSARAPAPSVSKSRSAVNLKYPIEHGIVTNSDGTERNLAFFPFDCLQAQDARHHGRHGPKGELIPASSMKKPAEIHDTSPMSCWQAARPCSKFFFFAASGGHDRCYRALGPFRLCEAPAGLSLSSQRVATVSPRALRGQCHDDWLVVLC